MLKKHEKYMTLALDQAKQSLLAGEFPVGCVFEYDNTIIAVGRRSNTVCKINELDHAEITALRYLLLLDQAIDMQKVTVYCTLEPCLMCYSTLIVNGIRNFVYGYEDAMGGGTDIPLNALPPLYKELKINIVSSILRNDCLKLFFKYFSSFGNNYLKDSYLAHYTLEQVIDS